MQHYISLPGFLPTHRRKVVPNSRLPINEPGDRKVTPAFLRFEESLKSSILPLCERTNSQGKLLIVIHEFHLMFFPVSQNEAKIA